MLRKQTFKVDDGGHLFDRHQKNVCLTDAEIRALIELLRPVLADNAASAITHDVARELRRALISDLTVRENDYRNV